MLNVFHLIQANKWHFMLATPCLVYKAFPNPLSLMYFVLAVQAFGIVCSKLARTEKHDLQVSFSFSSVHS